jgi:ribosomal protein L16 Arg81 hydroxylase
MSASFDLAQLLRPMQTEQFFAEYWERQPLLLKRGDEAFYRELLSAADLDDFISSGAQRYPAIRLAKSGAFFPKEAYTRDVRYGDETFHALPDVERIFSEYALGATVTLPALHLAWPPLGRLCAELEAQLDHSIHTNAYLTPPQTAGFTPHYDTHDVFILQIAGQKHWRLYPPPIHLPHRSQACSPGYVPPGQPLLECDLAAGDLLYLPRGYVHATTTADSFSAHVTIGITVYTGVELLAELLQGTVASPQFREALPCGFASRPELRQQLKEQLLQLLQEAQSGANPEALIDAFTQRVRAARPRTMARFHADTSAIGPDTVLRLPPSAEYKLTEEGGTTVMEIAGRRIRMPGAARALIESMRAAHSFRPDALPGGGSLNAKLSLVRYLHGAGVLEILASQGTPDA